MIFRDIFLFGLKYVCIWRQRLRQVRVLFRDIQTRQYWYSVLHSESCVGYPSLCFLTLLASLKRCNCILSKIKAQGLFLIPGSWIKGLWGVKENQTLLWVLVMYQPMCVATVCVPGLCYDKSMWVDSASEYGDLDLQWMSGVLCILLALMWTLSIKITHMYDIIIIMQNYPV